MSKVLFVVYKKSTISHEQCLAEWRGERHTSVVKKIPGLQKWIQNDIMQGQDNDKPDGIGELWFDDESKRESAMKSSQMAAAAEDANTFLDMEKTYALMVSERHVILG